MLSAITSRISSVGLVAGAFTMAASLTPSLIPRSDVVQGVLAGVCFAAGYGIAILAKWIWVYVQLPVPGPRMSQRLLILSGAVSVITLVVFLTRAPGWQNSIREVMGIPPVEATLPLVIGGLAVGVAILLTVTGKLIAIVCRVVSRRMGRVVRPRLAGLLGIAMVLALVTFIGNGLLQQGVLRVVDSSAQALDGLIQPDVTPPVDPLQTGSQQSLIAWQDLGREGRNFIGSGPRAAGIAEVTGQEAIDPVRVYAGLNTAATPAERARLATDELARVGGFDRSILVIAMPTGTGWMDPAAFDTLEYLHRGDVATIGIQYSYLQSWLSLLVEPEYSVEASRALFVEVYDRWQAMPEAERPRLYLYGLSLGAYSSQQSIRLHEIINQPLSGALWVGPPFVSPLWQTLTAERNPGSPAWRPEVDEGQLVRFTDGAEGLDTAAPWGQFRIVYLQYPSDPIVFFRTDSATRLPEWMEHPRGPDVSPELRWYPVISFLQQMFDMAIALMVPMGHGHVYAFTDHIRPWIEVTQPEGWDAEAITRLERHLQDREA